MKKHNLTHHYGRIPALLVTLLLTFLATTSYAQEKKGFWDRGFGKFLKKADNMVKSWQEAGVDTNYIKAFPKDRFVYLGSFTYYQQHDMSFPIGLAKEDMPEEIAGYIPSNYDDNRRVDLDVHTIQTELELGIDWRGISIEIPIPIRNRYDISFGLAKNGSVWGFRVRYKSLSRMDGKIEDAWGDMGTETVNRYYDHYNQDNNTVADNSPFYPTTNDVASDKLNLRIFYVEGYYVFNHKRFSLAAGAYGDMIQRRSAGSLFAWLNYYQSRLACDGLLNNSRDTFRNNKVSLGLGYGYNFSLMKGKMCIHLSFIPMFSVFNHLVHKGYGEPEPDPIWDAYNRHYYDAVKYGADSGFSFNCLAKLAASYNYRRMVFNFLLNYRQFLYNTSSDFRISNREADLQFNIGYRF